MRKYLVFIVTLFALLPIQGQDTYHSNLQSFLQTDFGLPSANYVFFDNEADNFNSSINYGSSSTIQAISDQDFSQVAKINVPRAGSQSFDAGWFMRNPNSLQQGDILLAVFHIRAVGQRGKVSFFIENAGNFTKEIFLTMPIDTSWRRFLIPFQSSASYAANALSMGFHLGFQAQDLEIGGISLLNYTNNAALGDLPDETNNEFYEGWEANAPWRAEAAARIDSLRKINLQLTLRDQMGNPLDNAAVDIRMLEHDFAFGTAITANRIAGNNSQNAVYENKLLNLDGEGHGFNWVVFENDMKWPAWEDRWFVNRTELVNAVSWLRNNNIKIRGHTLVWPGITNLPADIGMNINDQTFIKNRINNHLESILNWPGMQGQIAEWDVLNEIITNTSLENAFKNTPGYTTGRELYAEIFQKTRQEDSLTGLWLNDFITLSLQQEAGSVQYDQYKAFIQELIDAQVDIEGIGFQAHIGGFPNGIPSVLNTLDDFYNSFGLKAKITEFDTPTFVKESLGATYLKDILTASFSHPSVDGFFFWNFWDGAFWQNAGSNLFRLDWSMTPAGEAYVDLLFEEWWTEERLTSNQDGTAETRAFKGLYEISYICDGQSVKDTLSLTENTVLNITCDNITTSLSPEQELDIRLFPNPSTGIIQIQHDLLEEIHIQIENLQGQNVHTRYSRGQQLEIKLEGLAPGVYLIRIDTAKGWYREKLIMR
ncbi:MAG: endo-1,4-beta-xylanase [Bacteroidota bacterium]